MQHESWSQWIDVCKCDISGLVCAVQKADVGVCVLYFQHISGLLCAKRREMFFLNALKCVLASMRVR